MTHPASCIRALSAIALAACIHAHAQDNTFLSPDDQAYLEDMTRSVVEASRVRPGEAVGSFGTNTTGITLIRPGGRDTYPAFWIRDYAMSLECGFISLEEQRQMLLLTAAHQPDSLRTFASGSVAPAGSIPDHITLGGQSIFYPGTLDDVEGQGGDRWGKLPSLDDMLFFIHMAAEYVAQANDNTILMEKVNGKSLIDRLTDAYAVPPARPESGLVYCTDEDRGINFGFFDIVVHTGDLFFCSLLKLRAAGELADLSDRLGHTEKAAAYRAEAAQLRESIDQTFALPSGYYRASTGKSAQPDVWGTAFAVYIGALSPEAERKACEALAKSAADGNALVWQGNVRHIVTHDDFNNETAWESAPGRAKNRYQNGAYWSTPTGWVCYAIAKVDRDLSKSIARDLVACLRNDDYRLGPDHGAPWECLHPEDNHRQNPVYLASVTCPYAAFARMETERNR